MRCNYSQLILNSIFFIVIDQEKPVSECFGEADRFGLRLTKLLMKSLMSYCIFSTTCVGIVNVSYCHLRPEGFEVQCLYVPFRFRCVSSKHVESTSTLLIKVKFVNSNNNTIVFTALHGIKTHILEKI